MKKILILILMVSTNISIADSSLCHDYKIKIVYDKKAKTSKEKMCSFVDEESMRYFVSESCLFYKCEILKKKKEKINLPDYFSNTGSPGFKLCKELGGLPQIFDYNSSEMKSWQSTERCLFSEKDFVEISLLTKEWKKFITTK